MPNLKAQALGRLTPPVPDHDLVVLHSASVSGFLGRTRTSARLCVCKGKLGIATAKIQCYQTCGGRSQHNYKFQSGEQLHPTEFERELEEILPMRLFLQGINESVLSQLFHQAVKARISVSIEE
ncbi:hypothetical protein CROQUDRAFT_101219 [Cronartium quercuum f. sp. fusiforme G11]|uniref:Uncharacterized protein n=1 Tax=Cronartium quercuum f. sp. fusiforme G11 TaxID=708437 RepID=A0A9P6N9F6_9BASI|nr:hypothetical protein CROQUDRAFT_101219 [Cronartium quercuum f. sp. fusiforme G11]